jgi:uncharacterized membrane protein YphA (DoxX/SURF4 family)
MSLRTWLVGLALPVRVYLGVVFLAAAWYKIAEPYEFALSIATYDILPLAFVNPMAILLPWVEVVFGLSLILGLWTRASALGIAGMMVMFMVALAIALSKDLQMACGCFAASDAGEEINALTMVRDAAWLAGALYVLAIDDGRLGLDGLWRRLTRAGG